MKLILQKWKKRLERQVVDDDNGYLLLSSYYVSNPAVNALYGFIPVAINWYCDPSHFTDEELEA